MGKLNLNSIPIVILCGGKGIFLNDKGNRISKALVKINSWPLIFHVINLYYKKGFRKFILASGYQTNELQKFVENHPFLEATIQVINTGLDSSTGDRIKMIQPYIKAEIFGLTYSDTLSDVPLDKVLEHFLLKNLICTLVAAKLPTRFLILGMRLGEDIVRGFTNRPVIENDWINGGFYFFKKKIFSEKYMSQSTTGIVLEEKVLDELVKNQNLAAYKHNGFWQHLDNDRDLIKLKTYIKNLEN